MSILQLLIIASEDGILIENAAFDKLGEAAFSKEVGKAIVTAMSTPEFWAMFINSMTASVVETEDY